LPHREPIGIDEMRLNADQRTPPNVLTSQAES
jgi:hypothetical protein